MFGVARRLVISVTLVAPAVIGCMTGSAGAATTHARVISDVAHVSPPKVKLVGSGSSVTFDPSSLTVVDKRNGTCSPARGEWTVTNRTSAEQVVFLNGQRDFSLKPSHSTTVCVIGPHPEKIVLHFTLKSSPQAKLKETTIIR